MSLNGDLMLAVARFAPNATLAEADAFISQVLSLVAEDTKQDINDRARRWAEEMFTEKDLTKKIQCIKVLRDQFSPHLGLKAAKDIIDVLKPRATRDYHEHAPVNTYDPWNDERDSEPSW